MTPKRTICRNSHIGLGIAYFRSCPNNYFRRRNKVLVARNHDRWHGHRNIFCRSLLIEVAPNKTQCFRALAKTLPKRQLFLSPAILTPYGLYDSLSNRTRRCFLGAQHVMHCDHRQKDEILHLQLKPQVLMPTQDQISFWSMIHADNPKSSVKFCVSHSTPLSVIRDDRTSAFQDIFQSNAR